MFNLEKSLLFRTHEIIRKTSRTVNELLSSKGSTQVQLTALHFLMNNPGINQAALSQLMHIQSSTAVRLVDRMTRDGLVKKEQLSSDRRNSIITCTEKGTALYRSLESTAADLHESFVRDITAEEAAAFNRVLEKLEKNLEQITLSN
ncbi:MAG: MarR family winged helix-turn-helix transcriptional regulator [Spirochaetota bacterium]